MTIFFRHAPAAGSALRPRNLPPPLVFLAMKLKLLPQLRPAHEQIAVRAGDIRPIAANSHGRDPQFWLAAARRTTPDCGVIFHADFRSGDSEPSVA